LIDSVVYVRLPNIKLKTQAVWTFSSSIQNVNVGTPNSV